MSSRDSNALLPVGTRLGRYRIVKKMAAGGFGVVYSGTRDDGKEVAIKEFLPSLIQCRRNDDLGLVSVSDPQQAKRFERGLDAFFREADTLSQIHDDRIIAIWDVFKSHGTAYFAMPLEKGYTFHALQRATRWFGDRMAQRLFVEAARGVETLHQAGLLHLDLKPSNLWIRPDGSVLVLDLGASRWTDADGANLNVARTPGFAAPEQHGGRKAPIDERTDVYGLAASLRACLDGHSPPPAPQRSEEEGIGPHYWGLRNTKLLRIVARGMALDPAARYPNVKAFRRDLEAISGLTDTPPWGDGLVARPGYADML